MKILEWYISDFLIIISSRRVFLCCCIATVAWIPEFSS